MANDYNAMEHSHLLRRIKRSRSISSWAIFVGFSLLLLLVTVFFNPPTARIDGMKDSTSAVPLATKREIVTTNSSRSTYAEAEDEMDDEEGDEKLLQDLYQFRKLAKANKHGPSNLNLQESNSTVPGSKRGKKSFVRVLPPKSWLASHPKEDLYLGPLPGNRNNTAELRTNADYWKSMPNGTGIESRKSSTTALPFVSAYPHRALHPGDPAHDQHAQGSNTSNQQHSEIPIPAASSNQTPSNIHGQSFHDSATHNGDGKAAQDSIMKPRQSSSPISSCDIGFKFENATAVSLSQWQDDRLAERTIADLKRLDKSFIQDYIAWHATILRAVKSGQMDGRNVRILLYNAGVEGIGDRMRGMLHAYICAVLSERFLLVEWSKPFPLSLVLRVGVGTNFTFDRKYFGDANRDYQMIDFGKKASVQDLKNLLTVEKWVAMRKATKPCTTFLFRDVPARWPSLQPYRIVGYLKRYPWPTEFFPLIFKALFKATPELQANVHRFLLKGNSYSRPFIGIHARLGHDTNELRFPRFRTNLSITETAQCMAELALQMAKVRGLETPSFFLASDTVQFRTILRNSLREINPSATLMYGDWSVKHIRQLHALDSEDRKIFFGMFSDLLILSHADSILHMRSGFTHLARWMGGIEPQFLFTRESCVVG